MQPPKYDPARGHRGRGPTTLPAEGRRGTPPPWPLNTQTPDEATIWAQLWATPAAVAWERLGWTRTVARYARVAIEAEQPGAQAALLAQTTALEDRLGLTPKAARMMLWVIAEDEVADRRRATPTRRRIVAAT